METFRYHVSIPPSEVMQRLEWVVQTAGVRALTGPVGRKRFIGTLTGNQFSFRRWRWTKNTLASSCFGSVDADGSGSVITGRIGGKYGCFVALAISVTLMFTLVPAAFIGMLTLGTMSSPPDAETAQLFRTYWTAIAVIPFVMAAFFAAFFFLGRALTRSDEREMAALFPSLFSDVLTSKAID
jgi:hypothetical protein